MFKAASIFKQISEFTKAKNLIAAKRLPINLIGLSHVHKAHFIAALCAETGLPALVITADEAQASRMCGDVNAMTRAETAQLLPSREYSFRPVEGFSREYEHARLKTLSSVINGNCKIVLAGAESASQFTIAPDLLKERSFTLRPGESRKLGDLIGQLISAGYSRKDQIAGVAEFSVRGGLLDIFSPDAPLPVRIEFWGDEIDSVNTFDLTSQRRLDWQDEARFIPTVETLCGDFAALAETLRKRLKALRSPNAAKIRESFAADLELLDNGEAPLSFDRYLPLLYEKPAGIFDYFPEETLVFVSDAANIRQTMRSLSLMRGEDIKALFSDGILFHGLDKYYIEFPELISKCEGKQALYLDMFGRAVDEVRCKELIDISAVALSSWGGSIGTLKEDLENFRSKQYSVLIMAGTERAAKVIASDLNNSGFPALLSPEKSGFPRGSIIVSDGSLSGGFEYPDSRIAVISHAKTAERKKKKARPKNGAAVRNLSDLSVGDYVVHVSHGIGVFEGIHKMENQGVIKDYIKLRYQGSDVLYVPVTQLDLVSKYIGPGEQTGRVKLNKLNSGQWEKTRSRVKSAVKDMAKELTELYSKRMKVKGHAFAPDTDWQLEFEERFEFQETDDQLTCIAEIKKDMEAPFPMERLLCGDVGFGKTEVALRAAFKAVVEGKQCAILVPTTILAWQHYQTIAKRFEGYPVKTALLSRFRSRKQQEKTIRELRRGEVDIVVGTHRLVQKDIIFKDIGLAIIDEEQRFGVKHKEFFKEMYNSVDILTLSATPIPRTLNMAMTGIRDMSTIEEAPQDRQPVQTYVIEHNEGVVAEAIKRELRRDGQIYYLHNRIESIEKTAARLQELVPGAKIATAHGQMGEENLSEVWRRLIDHEIDVLVCTTIIETGVDVPNCNTLVIEDADMMGLAQLYQIRGRIGRSNRRAFAYFTFRKGKIVSDIAAKRLSAIREFTNFGSGFQIAMRDLEIRGAGNILGAQQHGHMEAVGYDMYLRLLAEAVEEERGVKRGDGAPPAPTKAAECLIDVQIDAHIPEKYIPSLTQRIDIYRRIAGINSRADARDVVDELIDRFGEPPKAVYGLTEIALLRSAAASLGVCEISQSGEELRFFQENFNLDFARRLSFVLRGRVSVNAGAAKPFVGLALAKNQSALDGIKEALDISMAKPLLKTDRKM
ncbi:MAG: transcription-repair coupling factor [Oscillospiraceae bacterium]|nr:transcription-repair coupling factor [Oscillospiraceae bacterium]